MGYLGKYMTMYTTHGWTYLQKKYREIKGKHSDTCIGTHYITRYFIYYQFIQRTKKYAIRTSYYAPVLSKLNAYQQFTLPVSRYQGLLPSGNWPRCVAVHSLQFCAGVKNGQNYTCPFTLPLFAFMGLYRDSFTFTIKCSKIQSNTRNILF
jgi:hypothetical protein